MFRYVLLMVYTILFATPYNNISLEDLAKRIGFLKQINIVYSKDINLSKYHYAIHLNSYTNSDELFNLFKLLLKQHNYKLEHYKNFYIIQPIRLPTFKYIYKVKKGLAPELIKNLNKFSKNLIVLNDSTILIITHSQSQLNFILKLLRKIDTSKRIYIVTLKIFEIKTSLLYQIGLNFSNVENGIIYLKQSSYVNFLNLFKNKNNIKLIASPTLILAPKFDKPVTNSFVDGEKIPIIQEKSIIVPGSNNVVKVLKTTTYYNIGLKLDLTYFNTSQDNKINLLLHFSQSTLINATSNAITTSNREISTYLSIKPGIPVLIAGLSRESVKEYKTSIPILDEIPLIKYLVSIFKTKHYTKTNSTLTILLQIKELQ